MRLVEDAMMRIVLKRIAKDIKDFRLAFVLFAAYNIMVRKLFHAFCPQLILTGFPCAGCGLTRAVFHILTGNFERGIRLNPAAVFWILFFAWFFWNRYVLGKTKQTAKYWLGATAAITLVIYLYRMTHCFPGAPPMVYYRNNLLQKLLRNC